MKMLMFKYVNHRELYNVQRLCEISGEYINIDFTLLRVTPTEI